MKKIDQLEAFISVVELESITKAANKLHLTTSAISQKITALESFFNINLFDRTGKKLVMTDNGRKLYQCSKRIMHEINNAEAIMSQIHEDPEGELKVFAPLAAYFNEQLCEFINLHPKIRLKIDATERIPNFSFEEIDLIFAFPSELAKYFPENTVQKIIGKDRYTYVATPEYLSKHGIPKMPEDLKEHSFIVHGARPNYNIIEFQDPKYNVEINPTLIINTSTLILPTVLNHSGITRLHRFMITKYLSDGRLIEILPNYPAPKLSLSLFYPYSKNPKPILRCFVDFMVKKLQDWPHNNKF